MSAVPASDPLVPDGDEPVLDRDEVTLPRAAFHTTGAGSRVTLLGAGFRPLLHSAGLSTEALPATRPKAQREAAVTFSGRCSPGGADCASPPDGSIALVASPTLLPGLQGVPLNVSEPDRTPGGLSATSYASTSAHSTLRVVTGDTSDDEDEDASGNGGSCSASLRELPVIEHYETVRVLGSGAFGTVKLIRIQRGDSELAEFAALKAPLAARGPHAARHLAIARREVAVLPLLRHRHIVRCVGTVSDAPLAVALECCSLGDLHDATLALRPSVSPTTLRRWRRTVRQAGCEASPSRVFPKGRGLPEELVWIVIAHVGEALRYLHYEAGVVHRDVKPKNLLVADDGRVKLCDFGSSVSFFTPEQRRGSHDDSAPVRVKNVAFNGSVNYAAPELLDQAPFDGRADVWALGCTAFEMMSGGARAFPGRSIAEVIGRVCCGSRAKLTCAATGYSAELCAVVESMLAIDADARTTSAELAHVCPTETYETALHSRALAYALAAKCEHQDAQTGFATRAERGPSCHASASEAESLDSASEGDGDASPPAALPKPASVHSLGAAAAPCAATSIDGDGGCSFSALIPTA